MDSWDDLLDYCFPVTPKAISSASAAITSYSAKTPAPTRLCPRFVVPDTAHSPNFSLKQEFRDALKNGLAWLPKPLPPPNIPELAFADHLRHLSRTISDEPMYFGKLLNVAKSLVNQILVTANEPAAEVYLLTSPAACFQAVHRNMGVTIGDKSSLFAVEMKTPAPLIVYGSGPAVSSNLDAISVSHGHQAIAVKVCGCIE